MSESATDTAHRWQNFRIRCLELAVQGGASEANMIEVADKLGSYILTKSAIEKSVAPSPEQTNGERDRG